MPEVLLPAFTLAVVCPYLLLLFFLENSSFHCSNTNARGVQKIVHGLLPQMAIMCWDATMGPRAMDLARGGAVAVNEVAVQSAHWLFP